MPSRKFLSLVLGLCGITVAALLVASVAGYFAHRFYVERARVKLVPTFESRFASENASLSAPVDIRVVMIGDSRIVEWQSRPPTTGLELVWRGIGGETTGQMVHRFSADTRGIGAAVVVIQAGINDLVLGTALGEGESSADLAFRNLQAMIESSTASGSKVILLTVVPPASPPLLRRIVWSDSIYDLVADFNRRLHTLGGPQVRILEADRILCGGSDRVPRQFARDTLHFLPAAYDLLNQQLGVELRDSVHVVQ
jgi:lysophospholipase L1-like esterase